MNQTEANTITPTWITEAQVGEFLGLAASTVRTYLKDGELKDIRRVKLGDKVSSPVRYSLPDLQWWMRQNSTGSSTDYYLKLSKGGETVTVHKIDQESISPVLNGWAAFAVEPIKSLCTEALQELQTLTGLRQFDSRTFQKDKYSLEVLGI